MGYSNKLTAPGVSGKVLFVFTKVFVMANAGLAAWTAAPALVAGPDDHGSVTQYGGVNVAAHVFAAIPNFVNGDAANFRKIFIAAGLAGAYRQVLDAVFVNVANPNSATGQFLRAKQMAAIHFVLLQATIPDAAKRLAVAAILGAARVAIWKAFGLSDNNYVATQTQGVIGHFDVPGVFHPPAGGAVDGLTAAAVAAALAAIDADADVVMLMAQAAKMGPGMLVLQGCTAVSTGEHHFVESVYEWFRTFIQQVLGRGVITIAPLTQAEFEDALCHKAGHTVDTGVSVAVARNARVKMALATMGCSGAAVRLPALTGPEKAVSALVRLDQSFRASARKANVAVPALPAGQVSWYSRLATDIATLVEGANYALGEPEATRVLEAAVIADAAYVGFALGYHTAQHRATKRGDAKDTISSSKFLTRIAGESSGAEADGAEAYEEVRKFYKAQASRGGLIGRAFLGAATPAYMEDPDAADRRARAAGVAAVAPPARAVAAAPVVAAAAP